MEILKKKPVVKRKRQNKQKWWNFLSVILTCQLTLAPWWKGQKRNGKIKITAAYATPPFSLSHLFCSDIFWSKKERKWKKETRAFSKEPANGDKNKILNKKQLAL